MLLRFLRALALGIGALVLVVVVFGSVALLVRWVQVTWFYEPHPPEHAEQKQGYLASLPQVDPQRAPNFVVVFFDDLGYGDLSSYGNRLIRTPRIDALAEQGLRMTHFYSGSSVCTPSRAALLTGRYPPRTLTHNHVFFSEQSPLATAHKMLGVGNEIPRDEILLSEVLGAAGYATGMVGKWHLGGIPGHLPNDFGFQSFYGVLWSNDMQPLHVYRDRAIEIEDVVEDVAWGGGYRDEEVEKAGVDQGRLTQDYTREAIAFIEANRDRPFFLYLAHSMPHVPHFASEEHAGQSQGGLYGDVVEDLDRSTGALVDAIDRLGLAERTLVLVTSDNGADYGGSPGFLRGRKNEVLEGGQRVPMIARWPGRIAPGRDSDAMAMNIDLFPTLVAQAGLHLPEDRAIDGRDLSALLERDAPSPHEFLHYFPTLGGDEVAAVRDARFKYLRATGDLGRDRPHLTSVGLDQENHDLRTLYPDDAVRLRAALDAMQRKIDENPRGWRSPG